jgi:hypothetical protein
MTSMLDDEMVMMDLSKGMYHMLEPVGTCIWNDLEHPRTVRDLCVALVERYDVDFQTCQEQVQAFLARLLEAGLLRQHAGSVP